MRSAAKTVGINVIRATRASATHIFAACYVTEVIGQREKIRFPACIFTVEMYKIESQSRLRGFADGPSTAPLKRT
jgi:hypothetical protein